VTGDAYNEPIPYHHRRWFPEEYRGKDGKYTTQDFFSDLITPSVVFDNWLDFWVRRTPPAAIGEVDGVAFFPKGFESIKPPPPAEIARTEGNQLIVGGTGTRQGQLTGPSGTFLDNDGNLWVADTNNNRVQKYDSNGGFLLTLGGFGSATSLKEPWSVVVRDDGKVFVADTWNHKLIRFDAEGKVEKEWGVGGQTSDADTDPFKLYAPRDITLSPDGNILIADTGNNRIVEYTDDGEFVRQFGKKGTSGAADELSEPVGIRVASNGDMYIGDFWNKRVVVLDKDLALKRTIPVDEWGSQAVTERAYMALLDDGRLLVTDPTNGKIITFADDGSRSGTYDVPKDGVAATARPIGISSDGTNVLVADSVGNVIRRIPLGEVAK
jgi:sugar lactone lactonase YvrE